MAGMLSNQTCLMFPQDYDFGICFMFSALFTPVKQGVLLGKILLCTAMRWIIIIFTTLKFYWVSLFAFIIAKSANHLMFSSRQKLLLSGIGSENLLFCHYLCFNHSFSLAINERRHMHHFLNPSRWKEIYSDSNQRCSTSSLCSNKTESAWLPMVMWIGEDLRHY